MASQNPITDQEYTHVIYRRWLKRDGGSVIALFPLLAEDRGLCASYEHIGQHGQADARLVMDKTRPAKIAESDVLNLHAELEKIGYRLYIRQRLPMSRKSAN